MSDLDRDQFKSPDTSNNEEREEGELVDNEMEKGMPAVQSEVTDVNSNLVVPQLLTPIKPLEQSTVKSPESSPVKTSSPNLTKPAAEYEDPTNNVENVVYENEEESNLILKLSEFVTLPQRVRPRLQGVFEQVSKGMLLFKISES